MERIALGMSNQHIYIICENRLDQGVTQVPLLQMDQIEWVVLIGRSRMFMHKIIIGI